MSSCKIITILIFLLLGCDMHLPPPSFKPPINIIEEINSEVIDAFTIRLLWNYDFNEMEVDSFKIYHASTENNEQGPDDIFIFFRSIGIEQLSPYPDTLFDYYEDIDFLVYGKWHYFFISEVQGEFESIGNDTTSETKLQIAPPIIDILNDQNDGCVLNNYDEDCKRIITNLNTSLSYLDSLIFIQKISSDSGVISIDTLSKSSNTDTTYLGLTICSDGNEELHIPAYCSLIPNTLYTIRHYFEQVNANSGEIRRSDSTSIPFNFNRAPISVDKKALTNQSCRLYFNNSISDSYYHSILIHDLFNTILKTATIDTLKNVNGKIILDIENLVDEPPSVYYKILGDNSFSVSMNPIQLTTLPDDLVGFRLLEMEGEDSANLYMSIYEIPEDYNPNTGLLIGAIPWEASYCDVEAFISELNIEYQNRNYGFRLPNPDDEWEKFCSWDFSNYQNFPWGSEIQAHNANYLNSQFPEGSNGITEVGLHPYPNANGIFDLSGNVMEWLYSGNCSQNLETATARGGAYYSPPESLECDNIFNVPVTESTGMGFHLILEFNQ